MMESLHSFFSGDLGLWGLFLSSFLSATVVPAGSELVLAGVLIMQPEFVWNALFIGTLGNTLGGMVIVAMGWRLPQTKKLKYVGKVRRFGPPVLLLAWLPIVGNPLCLAAGWLRLNLWQTVFFMAAGKFARYALIAFTLTSP